MDHTNRPTKEQVRAWLHRRRMDPGQLPDRDQIRRELGWQLLPATHSTATPMPPHGAHR